MAGEQPEPITAILVEENRVFINRASNALVLSHFNVCVCVCVCVCVRACVCVYM